MAVYTDIRAADLDMFVAGYDIGAVVSCEGIAQGIENSNFLLSTDAGKFVLTLYEKRVRREDLPFYLGLMAHLADCGFPCPVPVRDRTGEMLHTLSRRPAAIVTFLDGDWPRDVTPEHCRAIGNAMARLHVGGVDFTITRPNDLSKPAWRPIFTPLAGRTNELQAGFAAWIDGELTLLERSWPSGLPTGIIHADLFPDNVFFNKDELSGMIDFYFACNDRLAYDIAVGLDAWCFRGDEQFDADRAGALLDGYQTVRPLEPAEREALPILTRGAAMRFLLTRLHDWFNTPEAAFTRRKNPVEFLPIIEFHRSVSDSTAYGVG